MAMTFEAAASQVRATFPQANYIPHDREYIWRLTWDYVARYVPAGGRVLDFGSGPCDISAVGALMGFDVAAGDDLMDSWHLRGDMRHRIAHFARHNKVDFKLLDGQGPLPWPPQSFDMVMAHHVFEHIAESPRGLMIALTELVKDNGTLFITVPSAVNIRKRIDILRGRTNYPPFDQFYWFPTPWRGHRREYCRDDLAQLARHTGLEVVELTTYHAMLKRVPRRLQGIYKAVTAVFPDWRDSWLLIARRPAGWKPNDEMPAALARSTHMTGAARAE